MFDSAVLGQKFNLTDLFFKGYLEVLLTEWRCIPTMCLRKARKSAGTLIGFAWVILRSL